MQDTRQESIEKLNELIKDIGTAMLTTIDGGVLRSRPMATQEAEFDGTLFFLTGADTHKDEEIKKDNRVNVSYADTVRQPLCFRFGNGADLSRSKQN